MYSRIMEIPIKHLWKPAKFTTLSVPKVSISDPITEIISVLYGITDMAT